MKKSRQADKASAETDTGVNMENPRELALHDHVIARGPRPADEAAAKLWEEELYALERLYEREHHEPTMSELPLPAEQEPVSTEEVAEINKMRHEVARRMEETESSIARLQEQEGKRSEKEQAALQMADELRMNADASVAKLLKAAAEFDAMASVDIAKAARLKPRLWQLFSAASRDSARQLRRAQEWAVNDLRAYAIFANTDEAREHGIWPLSGSELEAAYPADGKDRPPERTQTFLSPEGGALNRRLLRDAQSRLEKLKRMDGELFDELKTKGYSTLEDQQGPSLAPPPESGLPAPNDVSVKESAALTKALRKGRMKPPSDLWQEHIDGELERDDMPRSGQS